MWILLVYERTCSTESVSVAINSISSKKLFHIRVLVEMIDAVLSDDKDRGFIHAVSPVYHYRTAPKDSPLE